MQTTVGQLLVNSVLPEDMRDYDRVLDKKGLKALLSDLARNHPEEYRDVVQGLSQLGWRSAQEAGGYSFGLEHLTKAEAGKKRQVELGRKLDTLLNRSDISDQDREKQIVQLLVNELKPQQEEVYEESLKQRNPLAFQVLSGSRGNKANLAALRGSDLLYTDHHGNIIPLPVLHSYAQGLTPAEYWAGTYGARKGVVDTKMCLSEGTEVLMADYSVKPIESVQPGDYVMGADCFGRMSPTRVVRKYDNGSRQCYTYKFRKGNCQNSWVYLTATEDHKVLAQIKEGRPGSSYAHRSMYTPTPLPLRRAVLRKNPVKNTYGAWLARGASVSPEIHEPRALLLGLMLGDGCMAPSVAGKYAFSCADDALKHDIKSYLASFNLRLSAYSGYAHGLVGISKPKRVVLKDDAGTTRFAPGHCHKTKAWLKDTAGEKLAHEKVVPPRIWDWDDNSIGYFLGGLFATDGCIYRRKNGVSIKLYMTSRRLVEDVKRLLELRFGIWCSSLRQVTRDAHGYRPLFGFVVSHPECVRKFASKVHLVGAKKSKLQDLLSTLSNDPASAEYPCKVFAREDVGLKPTYDLEVDNTDHLFVLANGLVVSNSTAKSGYLSKQLNQMAHRLLVEDMDDEEGGDHYRGLPADIEDPDNEGALLARDVGPYKRNTVLTPKIINDLKRQGHKRLVVRSPIISNAPGGGVYARDVGLVETGDLPARGSLIGMQAAQALGEPLSQGMLSSKHSGGVAGEGPTGFEQINALIQVPKHVAGGATHSQADGRVSRIEKAPAGGFNVIVDGQPHYVHEGLTLKVKPGDDIEAGDVLSSGLPNPGEVVRHKGIGEGRRYFTDVFRNSLKDAGFNPHRRNVELIARGLINHVKLTDEFEGGVPDDVLPYASIERTYTPRKESYKSKPRSAKGKYLERPFLHYTIGTKVRPSVVRDLEEFGIDEVDVHDEPPPFEPEMVRGMYNLQHDPDWMTRMYGSGLQKSLLNAAHRGSVSDEAGTSFVPGLSRAVEFGQHSPIQPAATEKRSALFTGQDAPGSSAGTGMDAPKPITDTGSGLNTMQSGMRQATQFQQESRVAQGIGKGFSAATPAPVKNTIGKATQYAGNAAKATAGKVTPGWASKLAPTARAAQTAGNVGRVGQVASRAAAIGGKALPAVGLGIDVANEGWQGYQRGRQEGYHPIAAPFAGFHMNSNDFAQDNRAWQGAGGYAGQAWDNIARPTQSLYTGAREMQGLTEDLSPEKIYERRQQTSRLNDAMAQGLEQASESDPANIRNRFDRVVIDDPNQPRRSRFMTGRSQVARFRDKQTGETYSFEELPGWAQSQLRGDPGSEFVTPETTPEQQQWYADNIENLRSWGVTTPEDAAEVYNRMTAQTLPENRLSKTEVPIQGYNQPAEPTQGLPPQLAAALFGGVSQTVNPTVGLLSSLAASDPDAFARMIGKGNRPVPRWAAGGVMA